MSFFADERMDSMNKVYCYSRCSTCQKALKWLDEKKIPYQTIDIKGDHPDEKTLRRLHKKSGLPLKLSSSVRSRQRSMYLVSWPLLSVYQTMT